MISHKVNRRAPLNIDREVYNWRHVIEDFFCTLMEFKRMAMRNCKTDTSYDTTAYLNSFVINSR